MSQLLAPNKNRPALLVFAVLASLLSAGPTWAAAGRKSNKAPGTAEPAIDPTRQAREGAARAACLDGNYNEGVAILSKLFVETKDVTYIYNQGRCFEQNRRYEDAIARFQEYLRAGRKSLEASEKAETQQHIADCKEMLAQERGIAPGAVASPPPVVPSTPVASNPPAVPETGGTISKPARKPTSTSGGRGLRIGGIVVAAVGVAAAGAGLAFNLKANSMVNDMYKTPDGYTKESDRKTYATLTWVGYGVGAACVVTGAVLYAVGLKAKANRADDLALIPIMGTNHAGAALTGAF